MRMEKSKKSRFFFRFCFAQEKRQGETKNRPLLLTVPFPNHWIFSILARNVIRLSVSISSNLIM